MLKIVVDAMGGDNAPVEIIKGAVEAIQQNEKIGVILTGDQTVIENELKKYKFDSSRMEVVHTTQVITNDDMPTKAIRTMTDSSLVVAFERLKKDPEVGGLVTAGSSGATLAGGIFMIGRIKGISRPALCPALPNVRGTSTLLCDCGANLECKAINLAQFSIMASAYARAAYGIENPKVGLLNNGAEEHKGDVMHQTAYKMMKQLDCINFGGNVEGREIMYSDYDVIVSDGFSGNVSMKAIEGCGKTVGDILKKAAKKNIFSMISALIAGGIINKLRDTLDYQKYGGSIFLGLKKIVIKSHGSSKAKAICASIIKAADACEHNLVGEIEKTVAGIDMKALEELAVEMGSANA